MTSPPSESYGLDSVNVNAVNSGITYFEYTYTGSTGADGTQLATAFFASDFSAQVAIRIRPATGDIADSGGNVVASGLPISPGYVVGVWLNHDTGDVYFKDGFGNTGLVANNPGLIGKYVITGMAGTAADLVGATITGKHNIGTSAFSLTPPAGAKDWCGNSL